MRGAGAAPPLSRPALSARTHLQPCAGPGGLPRTLCALPHTFLSLPLSIQPPPILSFSELKQAKAHERPPAALKLARFLPRKLRDRLAKGGGGSGVAADAAPGGGYARAPAGPTSDPDKRE